MNSNHNGSDIYADNSFLKDTTKKETSPPPSSLTPSLSMLPQPTPSSLKCTQILRLPVKSAGSGDDELLYTPDTVAWQCCFSIDGKWLAACFGAPDPVIRIWELVEKTTAKTEGGNNEDEEIENVWVLSANLQGLHERTIRSIAFAPITNPVVLASASFDGTVVVWEYSKELSMDWECMAQLEGHENEVKCVAWNSTGSLLASCGRDKSVWIWECFLPGTVGGGGMIGPSDVGDDGDFECIAVLNGHEGDVKCIEFAPCHDQWGDGDEILLSASYDNTIKCWAEEAGEWYCAASIVNVHNSTIWSLSISPGGGRLVTASADGSLAILKNYSIEEKRKWFPDEGCSGDGAWKCVGKLPSAHSLSICSVHCAPSRAGHGRIVSSGADNKIQIYKEEMTSRSDKPLFSLDASVTTTHGDVNCICWHPYDGTILASAGDDGSVRLWKYQT